MRRTVSNVFLCALVALLFLSGPALALRVSLYASTDTTCTGSVSRTDEYPEAQCKDYDASTSVKVACSRNDNGDEVATVQGYSQAECAGSVTGTVIIPVGQCTLATVFGTGRRAIVQCSAAMANSAMSAVSVVALAIVAAALSKL